MNFHPPRSHIAMGDRQGFTGPGKGHRAKISAAFADPNRQATRQQISLAEFSTGGSSWSIDITFGDPTAVYPSPRSTAPTPFTLLAGSSNQFVGIGPGSTTGITVIAGYRFNLNAPSSAGAPVSLAVNQAGIG